MRVTAYSDTLKEELCTERPSQLFEFQTITATFETTSSDSHFVFLGSANWDNLNIRFRSCCDAGKSFDPVNGAVLGNIITNYQFFTLSATEIVHGIA